MTEWPTVYAHCKLCLDLTRTISVETWPYRSQVNQSVTSLHGKPHCKYQTDSASVSSVKTTVKHVSVRETPYSFHTDPQKFLITAPKTGPILTTESSPFPSAFLVAYSVGSVNHCHIAKCPPVYKINIQFSTINHEVESGGGGVVERERRKKNRQTGRQRQRQRETERDLELENFNTQRERERLGKGYLA